MQFYVYEWLNEEGTVVYVGKGKDPRIKTHLQDARRIAAGGRNKSNSRFLRWLAKQIADGKPQSWRIVAGGLSEGEAFNLEVQLIAFHKRIEDGGTLYNLALGGPGMTSALLKKMWADESFRARFTAHWNDPEKRELAVAHLKTPERRAFVSSLLKARWAQDGSATAKELLRSRNKSEAMRNGNAALFRDEEHRRKHAAATSAGIAAMTPEQKKAASDTLSVGLKAAWADPGKRANWMVAFEESNGRPHRRQQSREKALAEWSKQERREAAAKKARALWADPVWSAARRKELVERNKKGQTK